MIAIDTNVLVRILVDDDELQSALARNLLQNAMTNGETCLITDVVLAELEWVLSSSYSVPRSTIVEIFCELLANQELAFENRLVVSSAVDAYRHGRADFSDYLIGSKARDHGASKVFTFDRALHGTSGFESLSSRS